MAEINLPYGKSIACECGKTHVIKPEQVFYERNITGRIGQLVDSVGGIRQVTVLADKRTAEVAGDDVCGILGESYLVDRIILPDNNDGHSPVCDDITFSSTGKQIEKTDLIIAVGSGVISDLGKWLACDRDVPCFTVATAASMNGYASTNIAPTLKGIKSVDWAKCPEYILADPEIIRNAPYELTASGLGDILAKSVSSTDWYMNHLIWGDYYCQRSIDLIKDLEPLYFNNPEGVKDGEGKSIEALFHALLLTGVAMSMVGTSSPASGAEHMISHTIDMMSSLDNAEHDLHGRQVGIGTMIASEIYRKVLSIESPGFKEPDHNIDKEFWGKLYIGVEKEYSAKIPRLQNSCEYLSNGNNWDNLRCSLADMVNDPDSIYDCLSRAECAVKAEDIGIDGERLLAAFKHSHEIRERFTVIDLARIVGVLPSAYEEITEKYC
ncbi:MAG: iron-containing alcohol dehydrogenase [Planctomycetota bacterium]